MNVIEGITSSYRQRMTIALPDNSSFLLYLEYVPLQRGWFFNVEYDGFVLNGARVVPSPNIFRQYRNQIPFGLGVVTLDNVEPTTVQAFTDGTVTLFLLTAEEVAQLETDLWEVPLG